MQLVLYQKRKNILIDLCRRDQSGWHQLISIHYFLVLPPITSSFRLDASYHHWLGWIYRFMSERQITSRLCKGFPGFHGNSWLLVDTGENLMYNGDADDDESTGFRSRGFLYKKRNFMKTSVIFVSFKTCLTQWRFQNSFKWIDTSPVKMNDTFMLLLIIEICFAHMPHQFFWFICVQIF